MKAVDNNSFFKHQVFACNCGNYKWEKLLCGTVEEFGDASCCENKKFEHLCCGIGKNARDPSFLKWKCVNNECTECSVKKK